MMLFSGDVLKSGVTEATTDMLRIKTRSYAIFRWKMQLA